MLERLIHFSIRHRWLMLVLAGALALAACSKSPTIKPPKIKGSEQIAPEYRYSDNDAVKKRVQVRDALGLATQRLVSGDLAEAEQRLAALEATNDGFVLAERDLELRGPGEFFGRRQSGLPELRLASLLHDVEILDIAQQEAAALFAVDPQLEWPQHSALRERLEAFWERAADVS